MKITFESKGDFSNALAWASRVINRAPVDALHKIAKDGEQVLAANTPKKTGETAAGWTSEITSRKDVSEIAWMNTAHPGLGVNIAKLIHLGHGTGTGGYVPPKPYIEGAMKTIWSGTDKLAKEVSE